MIAPDSTNPSTDPTMLRDLAVTLALTAAESAARQRLDHHGMIAAVDTKSSASDLVTAIDRSNEEWIVSEIERVRPGDGVIGEEGSEQPSTTGVEWIIDPIDGTSSFVHGYPGWTVSVAAAVDGTVVAGAVADPTHLQADGSVSVFSAAAGAGAHLNGRQLQASRCSELNKALVGTGFSFDPDRRRRQALALSELLPHIRDIRRCGSAALELCRVAAGQIDAFFEVGLNAWDVAAGLLIIHESGGVGSMTPAGPSTLSFTAVSAPGIEHEFGAALASCDAHLS